MKKKKVVPQWIIDGITVTIVVIGMLMAWSAVRSYPIDLLEYDVYDYIAVTRFRVITMADSVRDTTYCDTPSVTNPCSLRVDLHIDTTYYVQRNDSIDGVGWTGWLNPVALPRHSGGTATANLDSDDYDSIALYVNEGSGPYTVVVHCQDSSDGDASIYQAPVYLWSVDLTTRIHVARTNVSGNVTFKTATESLAVIAEYLPYYAFPTVYDTIVCATPATTVIDGYNLLEPEAPDNPDLCRCWGHVAEWVDTGGYDQVGDIAITFTPPENAIDTCGESFSIPRPQVVYSNDTGYFQIDLIPSNCLGGKKYKMSFQQYDQLGGVAGQNRTWDVAVPDSSTYRLTPNVLRKNN